MAYTKEILTLAVEIGDCMLRNGAEIYRVEDTVVHILSSYEVEEFDVYNYKKSAQIFFCGLGSACFCYLFGGRWLDFVFAFVIGSLEQVLLFGLKKYKFTRIITNILASLFVTLLATASTLTGLSLLPDKIIIGAIMPLVPGIAFTTSIRDIYNGDYLSGTIHLLDALITAVCVAVGACLPFVVMKYIGGI